MTAPPRAVWCTPHAYRSVARVGAHHLAARLAARGWEVLFLSNPICPLHGLRWRDHDIGLRLSQAGRGLTVESVRLRAMLPVTMLPFTGRLGARSRWVLDHWPDFTVPPVGRALRRAGFDRPDLLVIDGPIGAPLIDILSPRHSVARLLDRLRGFASTTPAMLDAMKRAAHRVDLVTYSAQDLSADVDDLQPRRRLHLPNGVDVGHFRKLQPVPEEYRSIPEPRAVYVGAMAQWFDYELVAFAARSRPKISFVMIGPADLARRRLPGLSNLHVIGARPWEDLPGYLQHAAVGLIPFDVRNHNDLVRGVNPLKLYEYAAAGLPVVSVAWPELSKLDGPIELATDPDAFVQAIDRMLTSPPSVAVLTAFAARHDWNATLDRLLSAVGLGAEALRIDAAPAVPVR